MMKRLMFGANGGGLRWVCLLILVRVFTPAQAEPVTNRFGFTGKEIFPIDYQISQLHAADIDGDGLNDLLVVNNARSKITLLYNQTGKTNVTEKVVSPVKRELNELPPGSRFRIESIASEKRISSLVLADLNGDQRPDIAYFGEPRELVVLYNEGHYAWSAAKRWPLDDGLLNQNALVTGDLNGDHRPDLLLLAENYIYWLAQDEHHALAEPEKIPYSGALQALQVLDIQGDGREDLLLVNWENQNPFRFRLQGEGGELGPEIHFSLPPIRSYWPDDLDGDHKTEVVTISQKSGRAQVSRFTEKPAEPLAGEWTQGQFQMLPLNRTSKASRGMVWADVTGDGLADLLIAEPESGQVTLHRQDKDGRLAAGKTFPSFTGVSELAAADWDGDGQLDVFALSTDERQIGVSHLDDQGRLGFPKTLPIDGRPLACAVGSLTPNAKPSLVVIVDQDGRRELQILQSGSEMRRQKLRDNFRSNPSSVAIHDADQDGLPDILVFIPYEKLKVLLQVKEQDFNEQDVVPPGGSAEQPWFSASDIDGDGKPELLLAQRNFLRAVVLRPEENRQNKSAWSVVVKEQINGAASNSRIIAAAGLRNGTNQVDSLFLLDAERKALTLCDRDHSGTWHVVRNLPLPVAEFRSARPLALGGSKPNAVAFFGLNAVGWLPLQGSVWEFTELDGYETPIKDGYLNDVISGDLNQDGRKDLVFLETAKSYLDVVTYEAPHQLVPANRWQVFEERSFRSRRVDFSEPREALIVELTGDKKNDLIVLVHDRLILYPQE
ncbi:MAG: VCBS repeat-containing protein [Verrucomicrobiota bacterium]